MQKDLQHVEKTYINIKKESSALPQQEENAAHENSI
jgi:hypothetical protein